MSKLKNFLFRDSLQNKVDQVNLLLKVFSNVEPKFSQHSIPVTFNETDATHPDTDPAQTDQLPRATDDNNEDPPGEDWPRDNIYYYMPAALNSEDVMQRFRVNKDTNVLEVIPPLDVDFCPGGGCR